MQRNQPRKANDFIGFASYAFDSSNEIRTIEKNENTAVIYGKKAVYFEGHGKFLQWIRHSFWYNHCDHISQLSRHLGTTV